MAESSTILLAAGGTGGHLFPAAALGAALAKRGYVIDLATDARALKFGADFPARAVHVLPSATPTSVGLIGKLGAALTLGRGALAAYALLGRLKPAIVVGFGGYPTVPPLKAAALRKIPTVIHEGNAVIGRANTFLAAGATRIASGFPTLGGLPVSLKGKLTFTGNPLRPNVIEAAKRPYPALDGPIRLLVTGGSQGARVMSDVVPAAFALLSAQERVCFTLVMQARGEDGARVGAALKAIAMPAEIAEFFRDLPERIAASHLIVSRAGASTTSEIAAIGRASILVPFPHALDQDQAANAKALNDSGAAQVVMQDNFTPDFLAAALRDALADPGKLAARAQAAKAAGVTDAAERLADLVEDAIR